ncbi:hypothetical protein BIW11_09915, partial [Tropilaelaps mercedesae]
MSGEGGETGEGGIGTGGGGGRSVVAGSGGGLPANLLPPPPPPADASADGCQPADDEDIIPLQIFVPELVVQKCFNVGRDELIWDIKQTILSSLPKELKESFNYGLYCPPVNGKSGKFLDEERPVSDYPLMDPVAYLELRYKRRVYRMVNVDEKQIKQLHTRANLRRLLDSVSSGNVEKVNKLCTRGLDPNFHDPDSGETPLTLAATLKSPGKLVIALINGGALVDYRTKDGRTALHRAVEKNNLEALKTMLDLGASPNYRDSKGLTPLYYTITHGADVQLAEMLLHDHGAIGATDPQGWQEVHQACKHGLVKHLDQLLYYGADINARNASGNTPLHVCAVNDQEDCLKCLLKRGADTQALNYANQTPYQVAVIAGNHKLADMINNHKSEHVGEFISSKGRVAFEEAPSYNPRRRVSAVGAVLSSTVSDSRLCTSRTASAALGSASREPSAAPSSSGRPPSRSPSNRSLPALSSDTLSTHSGSTFQDELAL